LTPPCRTRNGGRPESVVSIRSAIRRSESAPTSAIATASASAASAGLGVEVATGVAETAAHLVEQVFPPLRVRQ